MKFKGTKISKRTVALFAAAMILLGSGGMMGTRAALNAQSDVFDRTIRTNSLAVQILDNSGNPVGVKVNPNEDLTESKLYTELGEKIVPGEKYNSKVSVKNTGDADEYVRVIVRKYWTKPKETDGETVNEKVTTLKPELIELTTATSGGYKWTAKEETEETTIYYLNKPISNNEVVDLFSKIRINEEVVTAGRIVYDDPETTGTTTTINYRYEYDGLQFNVEAEAQSVQTHSPAQAIKSVWGVDAKSVGIDL